MEMAQAAEKAGAALAGSAAVARGLDLPTRFEVTGQGNGTLAIANLLLRVYKAHDDGALYEPFGLTLDFADLGHGGYCDLVVTGSVRLTDDKPAGRTPLIYIYRWEPAQNGFRETYRHAPLAIDLGGGG